MTALTALVLSPDGLAAAAPPDSLAHPAFLFSSAFPEKPGQLTVSSTSLLIYAVTKTFKTGTSLTGGIEFVTTVIAAFANATRMDPEDERMPQPVPINWLNGRVPLVQSRRAALSASLSGIAADDKIWWIPDVRASFRSQRSQLTLGMLATDVFYPGDRRPAGLLSLTHRIAPRVYLSNDAMVVPGKIAGTMPGLLLSLNRVEIGSGIAVLYADGKVMPAFRQLKFKVRI